MIVSLLLASPLVPAIYWTDFASRSGAAPRSVRALRATIDDREINGFITAEFDPSFSPMSVSLRWLDPAVGPDTEALNFGAVAFRTSEVEGKPDQMVLTMVSGIATATWTEPAESTEAQ